MDPIHTSDSQFASDVLQSEKPVLVDFWAEWCGPCKALAPKLDEIATEYGEKITVAKVDIDQNKETPTTYGVRGVPTLALFKGGEVVDQIVGNQPLDQIKALLDKHLGS